MSTYTPTCPTWCDQDHAPGAEEVGYVEHKRVIRHEDVSVDLVQYIEWQLDPDTAKWKVTIHPPAAVLGTEFDNAESLTLAGLTSQMRVLELAHRELTGLLRDFNGEGQG